MSVIRDLRIAVKLLDAKAAAARTADGFRAREALGTLVTAYLGRSSSPLDAEDGQRTSVGPQLIATPEGYNLLYAPPSLHGVIWMQVAMAAAGKKHYPRCKQCDQPFEISKGQTGKRIDREFCSDRCKSADYRQRHALARKLAKRRYATQRDRQANQHQEGNDRQMAFGWTQLTRSIQFNSD